MKALIKKRSNQLKVDLAWVTTLLPDCAGCTDLRSEGTHAVNTNQHWFDYYITHNLKDIAIKTAERTLKEIEDKIIGKDEKLTVVSHKYGTETGEIKATIGDGEEEWKVPRNELRKEQRERINAIKEGLK